MSGGSLRSPKLCSSDFSDLEPNLATFERAGEGASTVSVLVGD